MINRCSTEPNCGKTNKGGGSSPLSHMLASSLTTFVALRIALAHAQVYVRSFLQEDERHRHAQCFKELNHPCASAAAGGRQHVTAQSLQ